MAADLGERALRAELGELRAQLAELDRANVLLVAEDLSRDLERSTVVDSSMVVGPDWLRKQLQKASPDLLREMVEGFIAALMGGEVDAMCNAPYGQVTSNRENSRNGYRHRDFDTRVGTLDVAIPKL